MIGVYKITSPTNKIYIGQSTNIEKRFKFYSGLHCVQQVGIHRSLKKYGVENHTFEILCECEISELNDKERYYQDLFNVIKNGLNCRLTKSTDRSGKLSEETKAKIRISKKGQKPSDLAILNSSITNKNKSRPDYVKIKIGLAHKNKIVSVETRLRISVSNKGRIPYNKGIKLSKESIEKRTYKQAKVYINLDTYIFYSFKELIVLYDKKSTTLRRYINKSKNIINV